MPVYELGYEGYEGPRAPTGRRWWPLLREEITPFLKKRRFLLLLFLAMIPWGYGLVLAFMHSQLGDAEWARKLVTQLPAIDEELFAKLISNGFELFLMVVVMVWVGAGLVARDRRDGTLEVFLCRALSPLQYLFAKGAALGSILLIFSLLPAALLALFQVGLSGDPLWLLAHSRVVWGTALFAFTGPMALVLFVLALSSLSRSPRFVGVALIGVVFLGDISLAILYAMTKQPSAWFLSISTQLKVLALQCLGAPVPERMAMPGWMPWLFFALIAGASAALLAARFSRRKVFA